MEQKKTTGNQLLFAILFLFLFCGLSLFFSCGNFNTVDYRQKMRDFVRALSSYAKSESPGFIIITQNGNELLSNSVDEADSGNADYISVLDGVAQEDLFYGYDNDNVATSSADSLYLLDYLRIASDNGKKVLVIDYCSTHNYMDDSYQSNSDEGFISFAAESRDLDILPTYPANPYNENDDSISTLSDAKNFLYLINPGSGFSSKADFVSRLDATNFDIILIDLFYLDSSTEITVSDIAELKTKPGGGQRLVICYMSIGEAEDYRYYWQPYWNTNPPEWLDKENPEWEGNYKVKYWYPEWQSIIFGSADAYLDKIISAGFDGVYLDIIDAFWYFEEN